MVIDSHTLVWWLEEPEQLSPLAADHMERLDAGETRTIVSPVTFWELRLKESKGRFEPKTPVRQWPALLRKAAWLRIPPTDSKTWLLAAELDWKYRDPADRLIAATAVLHGVAVLTKDRVFHQEDCPVKAVW